MTERPERRRRRAVGPPGGVPADEPELDLEPPPARDDESGALERYRRERPPHHDRGG